MLYRKRDRRGPRGPPTLGEVQGAHQRGFSCGGRRRDWTEPRSRIGDKLGIILEHDRSNEVISIGRGRKYSSLIREVREGD
jgi:hypothetical protein